MAPKGKGKDAKAAAPPPAPPPPLPSGIDLVRSPELFGGVQSRLDILGEAVKGNVQAVNKQGNTALMEAAAGGHRAVVQDLLAKGANIEGVDDDGWTAMHFAAASGYVDIVNALLLAGADEKTKDKYGMTPIVLARDSGLVDVVAALENPVRPRGSPASSQPSGSGVAGTSLAIVFCGMHKEEFDADFNRDTQFNRDQELRTAFQRFGAVMRAEITLDKDTGMSKGFGFVSFSTAAEADAVMAAMDGALVGGRQIRIEKTTDLVRGTVGLGKSPTRAALLDM